MKVKLFAAAVALGLMALNPAYAGPRGETAQVDVYYGDLDLTTHAGAQAMLNRIKRAAAQVCGGRPDLRDRQTARFYKVCVKNAVDQAVARLNKPAVTALHTGRDPRFAQGR